MAVTPCGYEVAATPCGYEVAVTPCGHEDFAASFRSWLVACILSLWNRFTFAEYSHEVTTC